ncbi:hypothetical protein ACGYK5_17375, partial [Sulfitobacter sp. 1A16787]|uniref:hypothetical protein n=1 Tax=Sulfitobacter sp. 1A16787 TaxID=3368571 RepID=UPI0037456442
RFSNAGRPPAKTRTSRRDPHQKTFTLAAVRQSFGTLRCGPSKRPFVPLAAFSETEGRQCGQSAILLRLRKWLL